VVAEGVWQVGHQSPVVTLRVTRVMVDMRDHLRFTGRANHLGG
jgi:hypothetical protein